MANVVTFLKNYESFGWKVRMTTAQNYLKILQGSLDFQEQKVMLLRIAEELVSSTEDLTMWLAVLNNRNFLDRRYRDEWEFLLGCEANDEEIVKILKENSRYKTGKGLLMKYKLPPMSVLTDFFKMDEVSILKIMNKMLEAIRASLNNRTVKNKLLLRFHNKVKHGMIVQDYGEGLHIRELKTKYTRDKKSVFKRNRNIYLRFDPERAKKMVETIETNAYIIKVIVTLLIADYGYQLKTRKRKLGKRQRRFWEETLLQ